ncbi:MAG: protein kinase, partial [Polyangiales bacterium]
MLPGDVALSRVQAFGNYDLLERVNVGGMAEIFRARVRSTGQICAIKRILPEVTEDEEFVRMFRDEAKIASLLDHPSIAKILDLGRVGGEYFLALEFVEGLDLRGIFERAAKAKARLDLRFVMHVFQRVCEGLGYAHDKTDDKGKSLQLVHRDVSLQNVIVAYDGDVKLIDFGIAKSVGKLSKTQIGTIKGKYAYMSPEQVRGLPLDRRSDIFSLGICMHEMLTLKRLFGGDNELLIMERIKDGEVPRPSELEDDIPRDVEAIVMKALARDVTDRYATTTDIAADIGRVIEAHGWRMSRSEVAEYMRRSFDAHYAPGESASKDASTSVDAASKHEDSAKSAKAVGQNSSNATPPARTPSFASAVPTVPTQPASSSQEQQKMSDQKGSDLDVFEGLSSKRADNRRPSVAPPPPPPSRSMPPAPVPPPARRAATQLGLGNIPLPPGSSGPMSPRTSTPPIAPPPGRGPNSSPPSSGGSGLPAAPLPPPPPLRASSAGVAPAPAAAAVPAARANAVEMDWDDEDEKTHIYDGSQMRDGMRASGSIAAPAPPPPAPLPPPPSAALPPPPANASFKGTMVGMGAPLPPPPSRGASDRPLPPPPATRPSMPGAPAFAQVPATQPVAVPSMNMPPAFAQTAMASGPPMPTPMPMVASPHALGPMPATSALPFTPPASLNTPVPQYIPPLESAPTRPAEATQIIRPQKGSRLGVVLLLAFLAVGATAGGLFFMSTRPGTVVVNVELKGAKSDELKITLDGNDTNCKGTDCRIDAVKPGAHTIKAIVGDVEKKYSVSVEAGKDAVANLSIEIEAKTAALKIAKLAQSGVKVVIDDGKAKEPPINIDDLKPGKHSLKFVGGDKYRDKVVDIDVEAGDTKSIDDVKLGLTSVKVKFALPTKGTKASVSDGKKSIDLTDGASQELDASKSWTLTATAPGMDDLSRAITLGDDDSQSETVTLSPKGAATVAATTPAPTPTPTPTHTTPSVVAVAPRPTPTPTPAPTPAVAPSGDGSLFI